MISVNSGDQNQAIVALLEALQKVEPRSGVPDIFKVMFLLSAVVFIVIVWSAISERLEEKRKGKSKGKKGEKKA